MSSALKVLRTNLRRLRAERNWTQEKLAEKAGLTYRHYQDIEGAARPGLRVTTVERLAKALDSSVSDLLAAPSNENDSSRGVFSRKSRAS